MKRRFMVVPGKLFLLLLLFSLSGCASHMYADQRGNEWIARPLSELKQSVERPDSYASQHGWKENTYSLPNKNTVYVEPYGEDCFIHWEVSRNGIIIGYKTRGNGCERESDGSPKTLQDATAPTNYW